MQGNIPSTWILMDVGSQLEENAIPFQEWIYLFLDYDFVDWSATKNV